MLACAIRIAAAVGVVGTVEGFAEGVTGGGSATPQYPADTTQLKSWLEDSTARVIVLDKTFDFTNTEGTTTGTACAAYGGGASGCQWILLDSCSSGQTSETVTYYKAGKTPIKVGPNKTLLGIGTSGVIKGKGLSFANKNAIVQNIAVTDINHQYVWGGDAISFAEADQIWIDHVTTARPGRQHYVWGFTPSTRITLSSNFIDGTATYSATCNGHSYWTFEMVGTSDTITLKNNYIYKTSGRGPALSGGTLLHAVNNVWDDLVGHALEGGETPARGIFEGNLFNNVQTVIGDYKGKLFGSPDASTNAQCSSTLGRACEVNLLQGTTTTMSALTSKNHTSFFGDFSGLSIAGAAAASAITTRIPNGAGNGHLVALSSAKFSF